METIDISPAAESLIRDQISLLKDIHPVPANHIFIIERLNQAKHNLTHLLALSQREELPLTQDDIAEFRAIQIAPLVAEPTDIERLWQAKSPYANDKAAVHLLTHSPHYAEVAPAILRSRKDNDETRFFLPGSPGQLQKRLMGLSHEAQCVGQLIYSLLGLGDPARLAALLPGLDPQSMVAFTEACYILQNEQSE